MVEKLRPFINGNYVESKTDKYSDIYDPSTGEVIAQAPICTHEEVEAAVKAAAAAFPAWSRFFCKAALISPSSASPGAPPCGSDVQTP